MILNYPHAPMYSVKDLSLSRSEGRSRSEKILASLTPLELTCKLLYMVGYERNVWLRWAGLRGAEVRRRAGLRGAAAGGTARKWRRRSGRTGVGEDRVRVCVCYI